MNLGLTHSSSGVEAAVNDGHALGEISNRDAVHHPARPHTHRHKNPTDKVSAADHKPKGLPAIYFGVFETSDTQYLLQLGSMNAGSLQ